MKIIVPSFPFILHFFSIYLFDMNNYSENSKRGSSKEVSKAICKLNDIEKKHNDDMLKTSEGATMQAGLAVRASMVGRNSVSKMKNLKKKKKPTEYSGSYTDEDYKTFLRMGVGLQM